MLDFSEADVRPQKEETDGFQLATLEEIRSLAEQGIFFDFSIGNPSVPAPAAVNETAARLLREQPDLIHAYTSAQGAADARERFAA